MNSLLCPISPHITPSSSDNKGWIYTQPNTGVIFRSHSLESLQGQVDKHRFTMAGKDFEMDLSNGWQERWLNDISIQNPNAPSHPNPQSPDFDPPHVAQGRALWGELHSKASEENEPYALQAWFQRWVDRVPDYAGCRCRSNLIQILNSMSLSYGDTFKEDCIRLHDEINRRLGKKLWAPDHPFS